MVLDFYTAEGQGKGGSICPAVRAVAPLLHVGSITLHIITLCSQDIVDGFVTAVAGSEVIIPGIQNIGFCLLSVIARQILQIGRYFHGLFCAWFEDAGFTVIQKNDSRFFHAIGAGIVHGFNKPARSKPSHIISSAIGSARYNSQYETPFFINS